MRHAILCGLVAVVLALPAPARSDALALPDEIRFDVSLRGLPVGVLRLGTVQAPGRYAASARLETVGVARVVRDVRFEASVQGQLQAGRPRPLRYVEDVNTGRRESRTEMVWEGGVPRVLSTRPERTPEPWHLDPASQGGTLDPMTVILSVLVDVRPDQACRLDLPLFDGRRRGQVVLAQARPNGDGIDCVGVFRRVAGYSDEELAERRDFPFRLTYAPLDNGALRVVAMEADGQLGTARLRRQ